MPHICRLNLFDFEDGEELVFAELEEGVAFAAVEPFQVEDVFVERDRLVDVINLDRDVIASIHLHAHCLIYICRNADPKGKIDIDEFSYLSVLLLVIVGLPVTQILKGFRGLLSTPECAGRGRFECGRRETIFLAAPVLR